MSKSILVLEGGAMRGMYTAGFLDVMLENNIDIDAIIGVSAGALFGVNYFSNQKGRVIRYSKKYCKDLRYISIASLLLTGNIVNKNFAYYKVSKKLDKFDDKKFIKANKPYYAVCTNLNTGLPEYFQVKSGFKDMEILRASSSIPLVSKSVLINDDYYLDGAISDSIPVLKAIEMGYDKIIVILTRPKGYRKEMLTEKKIKLVKKKYKDYPNFVNAMLNRYKKYNETLDMIEKLETEGKIFVMRPTEAINVSVIERNPKKLQSIYDLGINDANNTIEDLKTYCQKQ